MSSAGTGAGARKRHGTIARGAMVVSAMGSAGAASGTGKIGDFLTARRQVEIRTDLDGWAGLAGAACWFVTFSSPIRTLPAAKKAAFWMTGKKRAPGRSLRNFPGNDAVKSGGADAAPGPASVAEVYVTLCDQRYARLSRRWLNLAENAAMAQTYLNVPFKDKDAAQSLGARWDNAACGVQIKSPKARWTDMLF